MSMSKTKNQLMNHFENDRFLIEIDLVNDFSSKFALEIRFFFSLSRRINKRTRSPINKTIQTRATEVNNPIKFNAKA